MEMDDSFYSEANSPNIVIREIKNLISSGILKPGKRINQRKIAKRLGITTTPLREAFSKLEREGVLKRINGVGVFVRKYSQEEMKDFYLIREVLEGLAARLCAERASESEIARLEELALSITHADDEKNYEKINEAELAFHELIASCSGSYLLREELSRQLFIRATILETGFPEQTVEKDIAHESIVSAIRARNPELAESVMRRHIANGLESLVA